MSTERHQRKECVCQDTKPTNPTDRSQIYNAECYSVLRKLETGIASAIITDPPYASGGSSDRDRTTQSVKAKYGTSGKSRFASFDGDHRDTLSWIEWATIWLTECHRIAKTGAYCMVFCDWRKISSTQNAIQSAGFVHRGLAVWDKGRGARAPHKGYLRHQAEYVVWGSKGGLPKAEHAGPFDGVMHHAVKKNDKHHLTGKPTPLMRDLVKIVPEGSLVLDPFMGSGTTGVACELERRCFIGIEMDTHYFQVAHDRIAQAGA